VERRVERGDLHGIGELGARRGDAEQPGGLVQRRERHERVQRGQQRIVDERGPPVVRPAVHDAVPDHVDGVLTGGCKQLRERGVERVAHVRRIGVGFVAAERGAVPHQARLQRGRPRVEGEDRR